MTRMLSCSCAAYAVFAAVQPAPASNAPPLIPVSELFDRDGPLPAPIISKDGKWIAYFAEGPGRATKLKVAVVAKVEETKYSLGDDNRCIIRMNWSTSTRFLLLQVRPACTLPGQKEPVRGFHYLRFDLTDGSLARITPPSRFRQRLHLGRDKPYHALVTFDLRDPRATEALMVDLRSARSETVVLDGGSSNIAVDSKLRPLLSVVRTSDGGSELRVRAAEGKWQEAGRYSVVERYGFRVLGIRRDRQAANLIDTLGRDLAFVSQINLKTAERTVLYADKKHDVLDAVFDPDGQRLLAVKLSGQLRRWHAVDQRQNRHISALQSKLGGELSLGLCCGEAGSGIVSRKTDRAQERHYIYQPSNGSITEIKQTDGQRPSYASVPTYPVSIPAGDGLLLPSYLTLPAGRKFRQATTSRMDLHLPLVLLVHGGPALTDTWSFQPQRQWLANRGYAVLAVNYRGSTGYGKHFTQAGIGEWGGKMHSDLMDAVEWAVREGIADPRRVAIMGHSYGGYAALIGLATASETFACGVAISAPTSLALMLKDLESFRSLAKTPLQKSFVESQIARYRLDLTGSARSDTDIQSALERRSPLSLSGNITKPLLLVHGMKDRGVRARHASMLFGRLARQGTPAALVTFNAMGHTVSGRYRRQVVALFAERLLAGCIGGRKEMRDPKSVPNVQFLMRSNAYPF